jgi:hypothetical protein
MDTAKSKGNRTAPFIFVQRILQPDKFNQLLDILARFDTDIGLSFTYLKAA